MSCDSTLVIPSEQASHEWVPTRGLYVQRVSRGLISACGCESKAFQIEFCFLTYYYSSRLKLPFSQVLYTVEDEGCFLAMTKQGSTNRSRM
jgi:hypothetical protein